MTIKYFKVPLATGLFCLSLLPNMSHAELTPNQINLLTVASEKDRGKHFMVLVDLLIIANPADEVEIRRIARTIMPKIFSEPKASAPTNITSPMIINGTIFSDSGAEQLSKFILPGWDKEVELNGLVSSGNTSQKSFGVATKFHRENEAYEQTVATYFDYNTSKSITNKRRYGVSFKNDYSINNSSYVTGFAGVEADSFGAFNKRLTINSGYGLRVFDNDKYKWNFEGGPAMLITKPLATGKYGTDILVYGSSLFTWNINERSDFENETKVFMGSKVVIENKTDYKLKVSGALSGKLSFDVIYNRDAPIGRKNTDTITRIGVLYDF